MIRLVQKSKRHSSYIQWTAIAPFFADRTAIQCKAIYRKLCLEGYIRKHLQDADADAYDSLGQNENDGRVMLTDKELGQMEFKTMSKFERFRIMAELMYCQKDIQKMHKAFPQMEIQQL